MQRFGFKADSLNGAGFAPSQRLQSATINRAIEGSAAPNTLVQLVTGYDNSVINQVLVDSSGIYRFDNVPMGNSGSNYQILLYANGQLANTPIRQEANFLNLPGQLTAGTSSLIASAGLSQQQNSNSGNNFLGNFSDPKGGIAYRQGISDALTLGIGVVYDKALLGLADIYYQPSNIPLTLAISAFQSPDKFKYNADIQLRASSQFNLNLSSNEQFQSFSLNWNLFSKINFSSNGNNRTNLVNASIGFSQNIASIPTTSNIKVDSLGQLDWNFTARLLRNLNFSARANNTNSSLELNYESPIFNLSGEETLTLSKETINTNNLLALKWKYRSPSRPSDQRPYWDWDIGYGIGSQGSGIIASIATVVIPSLSLRFRYDGISTTSNTSSFRIELASAANFSPNFMLTDTRFEELRSKGGILMQPFLDLNNNGLLDRDEEIYTKDLDLLLLINNKKFNPNYSDITSNRILIRLSPQLYRIDLDPSGYPLDWKPYQTAIAVEVVAGTYTKVAIPFVASYTVAGTLKDSQGNPISGGV